MPLALLRGDRGLAYVAGEDPWRLGSHAVLRGELTQSAFAVLADGVAPSLEHGWPAARLVVVY
jgi:hypothetical protein